MDIERKKMIKQTFRENGLVADLFMNGTTEPQHAILMLGGSEGGNSWSRIRPPIEYFVKNGYAVLTMAYFKAPGLPKSLQEISLEYFGKAFDWLAAQERIIADRYAIVGGSKGAEAALVLGSKYPQVNAVIGFSPSSVVWQGIPARRFEINQNVKSSWAYEKKGLPFVAYPQNARKADLLLLRLRKMH